MKTRIPEYPMLYVSDIPVSKNQFLTVVPSRRIVGARTPVPVKDELATGIIMGSKTGSICHEN